jgi:3-oxoacyl-[acyl-carrier-protein] synthase III
MDETLQAGKLKAGDMIAMAGLAAGLTWGSAILEWL